MHTVRIISHKSDRASRKWLITLIAHPYITSDRVVAPSHNTSAGRTIFDYDMIDGRAATVEIIDLDWSTDLVIGPADVFYVEMERAIFERGALNRGKLSWAEKASEPAQALWINANGGTPYRHPPGRVVMIETKYAPDPWFELIRDRFDITGAVQSTRMLLEPLDVKPVVSDVQHATIALPPRATITGITYDPATGALTVAFE